jgi:hypothetical protein
MGTLLDGLDEEASALFTAFHALVDLVAFFGVDVLAWNCCGAWLSGAAGGAVEARARSCIRWSRKYGGFVNSFNKWLTHSGI